MRSRKTQAIPARLEAGRRRFERWRRTRRAASGIPEPLWTSAVKLAGAYGLCRTARALRVAEAIRSVPDRKPKRR